MHSTDKQKAQSHSTDHETQASSGQDKAINWFSDNRATAVTQRKLKEIAHKSLRTKHAGEPAQAIAVSNHTTQRDNFQKNNHTGLPEKLKAGIEHLSGYSMDDVNVHYNSGKPSSLNAHAYAQGTDIHLAPGQERHLPHEAWHVVQQKQHRVKPTMQTLAGTQINDDKVLEYEADRMGARAAMTPANTLVVSAKQSSVIPQESAPVQRKIYYRTVEYPTTWKQIPKKTNSDMQKCAMEIWTYITSTVDNCDTDKLEKVWNRIAKTPKKSFDIETETKKLIKEIMDGYSRSKRSQGQYRKRKTQVEQLITPFLEEENSPFEYKSSARNPMLVHSHMTPIRYDTNMPRQQQFGRHVSTMVLSQNPEGQEVQSSLQRDGLGMYLSSNLNSTNTSISGKLRVAEDLKNMASQLLEQVGFMDMTREQAMQNRTVRHMIKLYLRIHQSLSSDAPVNVPQNVTNELDGRHAEIRIEQSPGWSEQSHYTPTGTKYPCMGCYLYFAGKRIEIGHWYGPMWITNSALTTQLENLLLQQQNFGSFEPTELQKVGTSMFNRFDELPDESHMGMGITKQGGTTIDYDADSGSDVDEEDFKELKKRVKARNEGTPMSPQWDGSSTWQPPDETKVDEDDTKKISPQTPQQQIDIITVNNAVYAVNDPRIRSGGECLWDTLRVYNFSDDVLTAAATCAGLTIDQHVILDQIPNLIDALQYLTQQNYGYIIDVFGYDGTFYNYYWRQGDSIIRMGLAVAPDAQGHYIPTWG